MARHWEDCTPGLRSKQISSLTYFCKGSVCFIGNQQTDVMKWGRTTKQLGYKRLCYTASQGITCRSTGRGLPTVLLSSEEQKGPHRHEAHCHADNLHLHFAPARYSGLLLS